MGAGAKIVCTLALLCLGTITLVQYAAYLYPLPCAGPMSLPRWWERGGYHSIPITLVRVVLHFFSLQVSNDSEYERMEDTANDDDSYACTPTT